MFKKYFRNRKINNFIHLWSDLFRWAFLLFSFAHLINEPSYYDFVLKTVYISFSLSFFIAILRMPSSENKRGQSRFK